MNPDLDLRMSLATLADIFNDKKSVDDAMSCMEAMFGEYDAKTYTFSEWNMPADQALEYAVQASSNPKLFDRMMTDVGNQFKGGIHERLREGNYNGIVQGTQGSGKSVMGVQIYLYVCDVSYEFGIPVYHAILTWNIPQTLDAYAWAPRGAFILQDEDSNISGFGEKNTKLNWGNLVKLIRKNQVHSSISCPEKSTPIPGCDFIIKPFGKYTPGQTRYRNSGYTDPSETKTRALLFARMNARRVKDSSFLVIGNVVFRTARAIDYMTEVDYEGQKDANIEIMKSSHGFNDPITPENKQRAQEIADKVIAACKEANWDGKSKGEMMTLASEAEIKIEPKLIPLVKAKAWRRRGEFNGEGAKKKKKKEVKLPPGAFDGNAGIFKPDIDKVLDFILHDPTFLPMMTEKERSVADYRAYYHGECSVQEIANRHSLAKSTISGLMRKVSGLAGRLIGHSFEDWLEPVLQADTNRYTDAIKIAGDKEPDFRCTRVDGTIEYVSAKAFDFHGNKSNSYDYDLIAPEFESAQRDHAAGKRTTVRLVLYDFYDFVMHKKQFTEDEILNFARGSGKRFTIRTE